MVNKSEIELGEWLGNSPLGKDIVKKKYFAEGETFKDLIERYSNGNEEVKRLFLEKKFIFGGRIIANRGLYKNGIKSTYSNCYVLSVDDSIESIYECQKNMARTYSYGGGVGIDISKLRPKGSVVHNSARTTSGAVSFMKSFDVVTGTIGQNGRRGALMISMDINHPEIESFIDIKANTTEITNANISVRMNDEFMKAVEKREDYYLRWPCDLKDIPEDAKEEINRFETLKANYEKLAKKYKDNPNLEKDNTFLNLEKEVKPYIDNYGCVTREVDGQTCTYKKVNAYKLFMHLAENNWDYGEPGILFWNKITDWHMMSENKDFHYAGVNPCLTGDTLIQTVEGEIPIQNLVNETPYVYCMDLDGNLTIKKAIKVWKTRENAELVEVITGKGKIKCTPDHRIFTTNRGWVEAQNLTKGDKIKGLNRQTTGHKYCSVGLSGTPYIKEHRFIAGHFYDIEGMDVHHLNDNGFDNRLSNLSVISHSEHSIISNTGRHIEFNRDSETGRFLCKNEHTERNCKNLGKQVGNNWNVIEVKHLDYTEDVYDMTVEEVHNFVANGMIVHNCAEEPLPDGGACLLGSMNLAAYVEDNKFNFDEFRQDCKYATIALNEILDEGWKLHPLAIQKTTVNKYKQIGLGLFDLAGAFIKLGIKYGSEESLDMAQAITHTMLIAAFEESCDLNKENIVYDNLFESDFYKNRIEPFIGEEYKGRYPRNSQLLTIAPTGTISTMVNASSGGAEPMYATYYTRSTKSIGEKDYYIYPQAVLDYYNNDVDSIDVNKLPDFFISADKLNWKERVNMQSILQQNIDASISSTINLPESATIKDVFDIYFYAWQKGLKGITVFRDNCKRVGILNRGVKKEEEQQFQPINAMKRPKTLPADFYQVKSNGETFLVLVGLMKDRPYEIFALPYNGTNILFKKDNETKTMNDNTFIKIEGHSGEITKVKKRHYSFDSDLIHIDNIAIDTDEEHSILSEVDNIKENIGQLIVGQNGIVKGKILTNKDIEYIFNCLQNIITYYTNDSFRDITLHVSMTLRHCIEPDFITKIEKKCNPDFLSVPNVIARILGKYTKVKETEERCPVCGEKLIRENGCIHCVSCGWSRCE